MSLRRSVVLALALVSVGCGSKDKDGGGAGTGTASGTAAPQPPAAAGTHLFVGDKEVATVTAEQVATWPRVDTLVPESARRLGKWEAIYIKSGKPKVSEINKPFEQYRDYVPALFPGEGGAVSFGMFDPVELGKKGKPALREDGVLELRIKVAGDDGRGQNDQGGHTATDPQNLKLEVKTKAGSQTLTGDKLLAIDREAMPGGGGDAKGWKLQTILEAGGVKEWKKILLMDEAGLSLTMENKDLDDKTVPFVKLNRQGSLRFRIFKQQGEGWTPSGDLRALKSIEVLE
jgi:hypothetical protein